MIFAPNVLTDLDAQNWSTLFGPPINRHRESIGLSPVVDVRGFMFTERPWLAADPTLGPWQETAGLDVVQTGAWILPDDRPLPSDLVDFLDSGTPPVYVGFGSMRGLAEDIAAVAIDAIRAQGRRILVGHGWAGLGLVDARDDCFVVGEDKPAVTVRQGGGGRAPRRRGDDDHGRPGRGSTGGGAAGGRGPAVLGAVEWPSWGSARPTTVLLRASSPCRSRSRRPWPPRPCARAASLAGAIRTDGAAVAATMLLDGADRVRRFTSPDVNGCGRLGEDEQRCSRALGAVKLRTGGD